MTPVRLRIDLFGWQPFYRRPVRRRLLAALDTLAALAPNEMQWGDSPRTPMDRTRLEMSPLGPGPVVLVLQHASSPVSEADWWLAANLHDRAWLNVTVPAALLASSGAQRWFALADVLVAALQPDFAAVSIDTTDSDEAPDSVPFGDAYYRQPADARPTRGLRTWLGPRLLRQGDAAPLRALASPAQACRLVDGLCIDAAAPPWDAGVDVAMAARAAFARALAESGLFGPSFDRGGVARETSDGMRLDPDARADGGPAAGGIPRPQPLVDAARAGTLAQDLQQSWSDLRRAELSRLRADGLDLSWAQLEDARLDGATIDAGDFTSANLDRARFDSAQLRDCSVDRAIAPGSTWRGATLDGVSFVDAVLTDADFTGATLRDVDFTDADMEGAHFEGATLERVKRNDAGR